MQSVSELRNEQIIYDMLWCNEKAINLKRRKAKLKYEDSISAKALEEDIKKYESRKRDCITEILERLDGKKK